MPRPIKLTAGRQRIIVECVRAGNTRQCAAGMAGINTDTLQEWLKQGRNGVEPYVRFSEQVRRADSDVEAEQVAKVVHADDPKFALAWLGRRRKTWGDRPTKVDVSVNSPLDMTALSRDELASVLSGLSKAKKATEE